MFTTTSLVTVLHNKVDLLHPFQPLPQPPSLLITINVCCIYKVQELNIDHRSMRTKPLQSCPTLCDPMDCSPPSSSVHGILQARILKWVAISFSRRSSQLRDQTRVSDVSCIGRQILYHCATWEAISP